MLPEERRDYVRDRAGQPDATEHAILALAGRAAPPRGCFPPGRYAVANLEAVRRNPCGAAVEREGGR